MNYRIELMLKSFFVIDIIFKNFLNAQEREKIFNVLGEIFIIDNVDELYSIVNNDNIKNIKSYTDYCTFIRLLRYNEIDSSDIIINDIFERIIKIKGNTFLYLISNKLIKEDNSRNFVYGYLYDYITDLLDSNNILAIFVLSVLEAEGIILDLNKESALEKINILVRWHSIEGLFSGLYYNSKDKVEYLSRLNNWKIYNKKEILITLENKYGKVKIANSNKEEDNILEDAFNRGIAKRNFYSAIIDDLICSKVINIKDKKRIITKNSELPSEINLLPLRLTYNNIKCNFDNLKNDFYDTDFSTLNKVISKLKKIELRKNYKYRPICIVSKDHAILNYYERIITEIITEANIIHFEVNSLNEKFLEDNVNNVFIKNCDDSSFNLYFLNFTNDINNKILNSVKIFLNSSQRAKFNINHPSIYLDLSAILPICLCDYKNYKNLQQDCDLIYINDLTFNEKQSFILKNLEYKCKNYKIKNCEISDEILTKLIKNYSLDEIDEILDDIVFNNYDTKLCISNDSIKDYDKKTNKKNIYGFEVQS